jgi:hypothetical protein
VPFDERFLPDFLVAFLLEALLLVEAFLVEAFLEARVVEARLLPLPAARFLVEAALVFLLGDFLVVFLAPREALDFLEADRPLLDFPAADFLRAFVVGILSSVNAPASIRLNFLAGKDRAVTLVDVGAGFRQRMAG